MFEKIVSVPANGRATQKISSAFLALLLGEDFKRFPPGTEFRVYEDHIPLALVPAPNGGAVCLAFDSYLPRGFPIGSFEKSDVVNFGEFQQLCQISRI